MNGQDLKVTAENNTVELSLLPIVLKEGISLNAYQHQVQYYETDMMGITHHANYIRWMEEARIDFMQQLGFPYAEMEKKGFVSPVKTVNCSYLHPSTFGDVIEIEVSVKSFNGVVLKLEYKMKNQQTQTDVCAAYSEHVFLDRASHFVRLKRDMPDFYDMLNQLCTE